MHSFIYFTPFSRLLALLALCVFGGCSGSDANIAQVRGTVTFNGKPIPLGMVVFEPDPGKGNRGPQGYAYIHNGEFDTRKEGKGAALGAQLVRITGGDGVNPEAFTPLGNLLFEEQTLTLEIAKDQAPLQLVIPTPSPEQNP